MSRKTEIITTMLIALGFVIIFFINVITEDSFEENKKANYKVNNITVISYDVEKNTANIKIETPFRYNYCASNVIKTEYPEYKQTSNCEIAVPLDESYIYLKNNEEETGAIKIDNYIVDIKLNDTYYLPLNNEINLDEHIIKVGNPKIEYKINGESITIEDNILKNNKVGTSTLEIITNNKIYKTITINSMDTIVSRPSLFNEKKKYLTCEVFTQEEAIELDKALESMIEQAGYGTRAGAVEAARFLTLSLPYRVSYYWGNGRLHKSGANYVDGEGRWYHKGLYLSKDKYSTLAKSISGPAMWGCNMTNWQPDEPFFIRGRKYPNGLDCSGFVSWALLNGGFDVGDKGAGNSGYRYELTDLGEYTPLTKSLINSEKIKVGDLFNFDGHISMLVGIDEDNFYVAESLNNLGGLVVMKYPKSTVNKTFHHVVLMDELYKEDGNLTNMWY